LFRSDPVPGLAVSPNRWILSSSSALPFGGRRRQGVVARWAGSDAREEAAMAFVLTQRFSTTRGDAVVRALRRRLRLSAAKRINLRAPRPPLALINASLGGHPDS
jgi:hypothetical protein